MTLRTLTARSLRFHWRGHLGVLLGAAVGSAALIGALVVGDSVRLSLHELALQRLGKIEFAIAPPDRFFREALRFELPNAAPRSLDASITTAVRLSATASRQDGSARANQVQVVTMGPGLDHFLSLPQLTNFASDDVILNEALAAQLKAQLNDLIVLRVRKPSALSLDAPISPQSDSTVALRLRVHSILPAQSLGNFSLSASQLPPLNAFVRCEKMQMALGLQDRANLLLIGALQKRMPLPRRMESMEAILKVWRMFFPRPVHRASPGDSLEPIATQEASGILSAALRQAWQLPDAELELRYLDERNAVELRSPRIFLDPQVASEVLEPGIDNAGADRLVPLYTPNPGPGLIDTVGYRQNLATNAQPILTYLVNLLRSGGRTVPYSMVTAAGPPWTPLSMGDDEILVNQWLAKDMQLKPGDVLDLIYFLAESGANLVERTNRFRVRSIVPMEGIHADRTLMPEFPGVAKAESTHEWDAGFPLVHKIRDEDETYWQNHRGTPKAFVTLAAGQHMWGNRFGKLTAIRFPVPMNRTASNVVAAVEESLLNSIDPASVGLHFEPVRAQALAAANQSQDFGGLFIGFSFFLILAALILMALLFQFGLEQRTNEIGTLLALGFTPQRVRNFLLGEGVAIAFVGGLIGMLGGVGYAKAMLYGLATLWRDAVGTSALRFHVTPMTLAIGLFSSVLVCAVTIWIVLRKQARRPARELLAEGAELNVQSPTLNVQRSKLSHWIAIGSSGAALAMIGWAVFGGDGVSPGLFFGAGALLLVGLLAAAAWLFAMLDRSEASHHLSISAMGLRGCTRRRTRSLASVALLACGSFLVVAVGANRLDSGRDASRRSSGTGGFALFGEATLPVVRDLNSKAGREFYGLDEKAMQDVSVVPFRVRDGDDASCLNLNRAQTPRLLGVKPELLAERKAFAFANVLKGMPAGNPWELLRSAGLQPGTTPNDPRRIGDRRSEDDAIPAIGDAASIQWALGKKLGDTVEYTDEHGQKFKVRLVAGVANSILQGNLIIDEAEFVKRFPSESGHRMFLIDVPSNTGADADKVSAAMSRALQDVGLELTPAAQRLAAFNAVQNTYLNTFQVLGGLGLLLGSVGLGVVVLRNVLERRSELGLLQAVGFRRRSLQWLVLSEHGGLLGLGLAVGISAAVAAVLPALLAPGAEMHYVALAITLAGVLLSGLLWTWLATKFALRGELLKALRNE